MKSRNISLILLILFVGVLAVSTAVNFMDNEVAAAPSQGTLNIEDSKTHEVRSVHYEASGKCYKVVDGDTIWVEGIGKIRFVQVNTPERGEPGYHEAKDYVKEKCLGKTVYLDIDDKKHYDKYNRTLAIVYTENLDINRELLNENLAEIMYIPPSEFAKGTVYFLTFYFFKLPCKGPNTIYFSCKLHLKYYSTRKFPKDLYPE